MARPSKRRRHSRSYGNNEQQRTTTPVWKIHRFHFVNVLMKRTTRRLSDFRYIGCNPTAAVHFLPSFWPIATAMSQQIRHVRTGAHTRWGRIWLRRSSRTLRCRKSDSLLGLLYELLLGCELPLLARKRRRWNWYCCKRTGGGVVRPNLSVTRSSVRSTVRHAVFRCRDDRVWWGDPAAGLRRVLGPGGVVRRLAGVG